MAVDTFGNLLALRVTLTRTDDRSAVAALAEAVQDATRRNVDLAYVEQEYTRSRLSEPGPNKGSASMSSAYSKPSAASFYCSDTG